MNELVKTTTVIALTTISLFAGRAFAAETEDSVKVPDWVTRMKIKGDIRARFEDVQQDGNTKKSRFRERIRIGAYGDVNDQMNWGIRLASGSDEGPTSSNQSLDDFSNKRKVWIDLGYFGYRPEELSDLHIVIGKIKKPWKGVSDLVWDGDFNPEGVNAKYNFDAFKVQFGYYMMKDNVAGNDPQKDIGLAAGQVDGHIAITEDIKLHTGIAGFFYQNVKGAEVFKSDSGKYHAKGNTITKVEDADGEVTEFWVNGYEIVDAFASLSIKNGPIPIKIYGEYVVNVAADSPDDDGWKVGIKSSFLNKKLAVDYNYRDLGQDAVLGALTDSDFGGGGAGSKGHKIKVKYKILKNCSVGVTTLLADNQVKGVPVDTIQADIAVKF